MNKKAIETCVIECFDINDVFQYISETCEMYDASQVTVKSADFCHVHKYQTRNGEEKHMTVYYQLNRTK